MNNENENILEHSVTAIAKSGNQLKAVELNRQGRAIEVIKTKSSKENVIDWQGFASECGLSVTNEHPTEKEMAARKAAVVGYDSAGTAFSRVNIPSVEEKEIETMVQLQAESRLPLPVDQMELAWRADAGKNGQLAITLAAARRQLIQNFINKINGFKPANIFLDCEGIVKAWKEIFSGNEQNAVIINADARNTQICLVQKEQLINVVGLDMGINDFAEAEAEEQTETIERFIQDTRSVVDLFGIEKFGKLLVYILSDGSKTYDDLASALKEVGLNASVSKPDIKKFDAKNNIKEKDIFEYRLQIGLALMVIDAKGDELNLFKNLYKPFGQEKETHWLYSLKVSGAIAIASLILFLGVYYAINITKPDRIRSTIEAQELQVNIDDLVAQKNLLTAIQRERPDLLALISNLTYISEETGAGAGDRRGFMNNDRIQLESFDFKRGKKVTITGQASSNSTLYDYEKLLTKIPGISDVTWTPAQNRSNSNKSGGTTTRINTTSTRGTTSPRTSGGRTDLMSSGPRAMGTNNGFGEESVKFTMDFHYLSFTGSSNKSIRK
jgi:hypothetical protein